MIAAMVAWRWTGYNTLLYLASLQAVPRELYEAAAVGRGERLEAVPPHHHPLAAADHHVHGRHVDDRRAADLHRAAAGQPGGRTHLRGGPAVPDPHPVPLRAGLRPVPLRLRRGRSASRSSSWSWSSPRSTTCWSPASARSVHEPHILDRPPHPHRAPPPAQRQPGFVCGVRAARRHGVRQRVPALLDVRGGHDGLGHRDEPPAARRCPATTSPPGRPGLRHRAVRAGAASTASSSPPRSAWARRCCARWPGSPSPSCHFPRPQHAVPHRRADHDRAGPARRHPAVPDHVAARLGGHPAGGDRPRAGQRVRHLLDAPAHRPAPSTTS